jgi:putative addiction module CopG family antidote
MSTNISLTAELESYAKNQVASGLYGSISEFVRDSIRMHRQKNLEHQLYLHEMHLELTRASKEIDQNNISPFNMKDILKETLKDID